MVVGSFGFCRGVMDRMVLHAQRKKQNPRRLLRWLWVLLVFVVVSWIGWYCMPMTASQKERNKTTIEYRSCYALMSGKDTLLYIGELTNDWTRTRLRADQRLDTHPTVA